MSPMKFYFMLIRRRSGTESPVLVELLDILSRRGHQVETGIAEEMLVQPDQLASEHDLVLVKSHTDLSLSLASILYEQGTPLLNPYPACVAVQDKIAAAHRLAVAGIPAPRTWAASDLTLLQSLPWHHPYIVKPSRGFGGTGIRIVQRPEDLVGLESANGPMLIQEYIKAREEDLKVYVIGDQVFAVRKPFSEMSSLQAGRPCEVSREIEEIALRCGRVFGLSLYGLDVIESVDGPIVVDVNYFPGYKGVPNAAARLADYIENYRSLASRQNRADSALLSLGNHPEDFRLT